MEADRMVNSNIAAEDLATEFGVSRERVRQIEVRAFEKVQKAVKTSIAALEPMRAGIGGPDSCANGSLYIVGFYRRVIVW